MSVGLAEQGVGVDQHGDLGDPVDPVTAADRSDHGVDLELWPWCAPVAVLLAECGAGRVDRCPQGAVADGVEFEVGVTHPGRLVGPTSHPGPAALLVEFVGIRCRLRAGDQMSGEVAAATLEGVDTLLGGVGQQVCLAGGELGQQRFVEVACGVGDGVDVTCRHSAGAERIFERRHRRADLFAFGCCLATLGRLSSVAAQQIVWWFGATLAGELALAACDSHFECVAPGLVGSDAAGQLGQFVAVHHIGISRTQHPKGGVDVGWTHQLSPIGR